MTINEIIGRRSREPLTFACEREGQGWESKMENLRLNKSRSAKLKARSFRKKLSVGEVWFWRAVRKDLLGFRFRRQVPVGPYFLDFYVPAAKLCIEIDGEQHALTRTKDRERDEYLARFGIETLRVPSLDFFCDEKDKFSPWILKVQKLCQERAAQTPFESKPQ